LQSQAPWWLLALFLRHREPHTPGSFLKSFIDATVSNLGPNRSHLCDNILEDITEKW
jgi:hypothetical protein